MKWLRSLGRFAIWIGRATESVAGKARYTIPLLGVLIAAVGLWVAFRAPGSSQPQPQNEAGDGGAGRGLPPAENRLPPSPPPPPEPLDQCVERRAEIRRALEQRVRDISRSCMSAPVITEDPNMSCSDRNGLLTIRADYSLTGIRNDTYSTFRLCYRRRGLFDPHAIGSSMIQGDFPDFCENIQGRGRPVLRDDCR